MHNTGACEAFAHTLTTRQAIAKQNIHKPADKHPFVCEPKCVGNEIENNTNSHCHEAIHKLRGKSLPNAR